MPTPAQWMRLLAGAREGFRAKRKGALSRDAPQRNAYCPAPFGSGENSTGTQA